MSDPVIIPDDHISAERARVAAMCQQTMALVGQLECELLAARAERDRFREQAAASVPIEVEAHLSRMAGEYQRKYEECQVERDRLAVELLQARASILNQCGDNLCWTGSPDDVKAIPEAEFLESCRRYRKQIADEHGEFTGGRTIAQLEGDVEKLRAEANRLADELVREMAARGLAEQQLALAVAGQVYGVDDVAGWIKALYAVAEAAKKLAEVQDWHESAGVFYRRTVAAYHALSSTDILARALLALGPAFDWREKEPSAELRKRQGDRG